MLIKYIESEKLLPHELTDSDQVKNVLQSLETEKILKNAVVVDRNTNLILDGHHRYAALKKLWVKYIPTIPVDYHSDNILLGFWREWFTDTKSDIITKAKSWFLYPIKTTKHSFNMSTEINLDL